MIDHATRFSAASVVKSKKTDEVVDAFIKHWIAIFGAPGTILSDNRGEFSNELFHVLGQQINKCKNNTRSLHGQMYCRAT